MFVVDDAIFFRQFALRLWMWLSAQLLCQVVHIELTKLSSKMSQARTILTLARKSVRLVRNDFYFVHIRVLVD